MANSIGIYLVAVFLSAVSQLLLKISSGKDRNHFIREYLNIHVIAAYSLFLVSTMFIILSLRTLPFKMSSVLESSGYVFVLILSRVVLKERLTQNRLCGMALIILGALIFGK